MFLKGKTALVTGSTSGIGLAIAHAFAAEGANLLINGFGDPDEVERSRAALEQASGGRALYSAADLTRADAIEAMMAAAKEALVGALVLAPPSAIADRWARRLAEPVVCAASGWMRVRQRAKQGGVELPLVISDHADWDELNATLDEVGAPEVWVTHGREEALIYAAEKRGIHGRALRLLGYGEEEA